MLGASIVEQQPIAESFSHPAASQSDNSGETILALRFRADKMGHIDLDGFELNSDIFGAVADSWKSGFDAVQFVNYNIYGLLGP